MDVQIDNEKMWTAKADKRWWHIEEYLTGKKALVIGRKMPVIQINWYSIDNPRFSVRCFRSRDMFHIHFVLFGKVVEFHYYKRT